MSRGNGISKKKDLQKFLKEHGYEFIRNGKHEIWGNGRKHVSIPHGKNGSKDVNEMVAMRLCKEVIAEKKQYEEKQKAQAQVLLGDKDKR